MDLIDILKKAASFINDPMQKINEKWDEQKPTIKTSVQAGLILIGLILFTRPFMFILIAAVATLRVFYHGGLFKHDESEPEVPADENPQD